jgi:hypothetical protein
MNKPRRQIAQGDLLFVPVEEIPNKGEQKEIKDGVIARGEIHGHLHRISQGSEAVLKSIIGVLYIEAIRACTVEHVNEYSMPTGEHNEVILPTGNWKVKRQQEWTPEGYRQVAD